MPIAGVVCRIESVVVAFAAAVDELDLLFQQWSHAQFVSKLFVLLVSEIIAWCCGQMLVLV